MRAVRICVTAALPLMFVPTASALAAERSTPIRAAFLEEKAAALAPYAFVRFCVEAPEECTPKQGAENVRLSADVAVDIASINKSVNHGIAPRNDRRGRDIWTLSPRYGDCDDYAVTKRRKLVEAGLPARSVRLAIGRTPDGQGHAVVIVRTRNADLVLDSRSDAIKRVNEVDLVWIKMESADNPKWWYAL
ncbi:transglutaminase-like cysteine peptidase [Rhizobium sp. S153]|uniref:Transglutaminase-like cysteine peptidase n=1 Tax=Ciceribacter sichuanensis TaxID=2949647 RepID=A0ABT0V1F2_9HYPH|nr:transglutaminase-like cysteine peptidase [Ciceribacter sp. S153]MCM2399719.1 transglutaminase-like cysteine peptidase [Ciceribacter sp. S153]